MPSAMSLSKPQLTSDSLVLIEDVLAADELLTPEEQHHRHSQCLSQSVLRGGSATEVRDGVARCKAFVERGVPAYDPLSEIAAIGRRQVLTDLVGSQWNAEAAEEIGGLMDLYFAKGYIDVDWSAAGYTPNGNYVDTSCALEFVIERGYVPQMGCLLRNGAHPLLSLSQRKGSIQVRDLIAQQTHQHKDEMLAQATEILMHRQIGASVDVAQSNEQSPATSNVIPSRRRHGI